MKPQLDKEVEKWSKVVAAAQAHDNNYNLYLLYTQGNAWLQHPWAKLHVDYVSPIFGQMLLIVSDSHCK